ncbi:MAG: D-glycero-beta-D-manno-heptose 1,7-bisphosphate 7-phosphatase [Bacteroidales bacterium]|nr:D-glycero-beta-D-manno-heptose 1,7-bisphosphate 7-phosphatase [Bacteroidales bacterium]
MKRPAVFLDRDGTVCEEVGYLREVKDLQLIPGSAQAIRQIKQAGWKVVIISNQSGVARGYLTEQTVQTIHTALQEMLQKEGAGIDGMYYCPHHPKGNPPYNIQCRCRKPEAGMLRQAGKDLDLDLNRSIVIGDKLSDVQTAQRLNIPGILVLTGFGKGELEKYQQNWEKEPDHIAENLLEAASWFLKNSSIKEKR